MVDCPDTLAGEASSIDPEPEPEPPLVTLLLPEKEASADDTLEEASAAGQTLNKKSFGSEDHTCAICLDHIDPEELAVIKGCEHQYCSACILRWAVLKEPTTCPKCKAPFEHLFTFRKLDGSLSDFAVEEPVCLLKRTHWFQVQLKVAEKGKAIAAYDTADDGHLHGDWQDLLAEQIFQEYDDDEVEDYYFSSAAGRARIVLGNRRWGENGYVASGRMQARPVPPTVKGGKGKAPAGKSQIQQQNGLQQAKSSTPAKATPAKLAVGNGKAPLHGDECTAGRSPSGEGSNCRHQGRRARRSARRAAAAADPDW